MIEAFGFFVGVDLGAARHAVVVLGSAGEVLGKQGFDHAGAGVAQLFSWLAKLTGGAGPEHIAFAAETPRGSIVESALSRGHAVFSINPKQVDRFRDRFSVAGAKSDQRDALVLASSLRTDQQHFRRLHLGDPRLVLLREISRSEEQLQENFRRCVNQLWSFLQRYFPALLTLLDSPDEAWLWSLLQAAPLPASAARIKLPRLEKLLSKHRIRRFSATELKDLLAQPPLPVAPGVAEAMAESVLLVLPQLRLLHKQLAQVSSRLEKLLEELRQDTSFAEHRDIDTLRAFPGLGQVFTVTVLAEAHLPLVDRDYHAVRALAGIAPVTKQSGKTKLVQLRHACNHRVRHAVFHSANVFAQKDPRAKQQYKGFRAKGHSHARALRGVADRMLDLLFTLLKNNSSYDPKRRLVSGTLEGTPPQKQTIDKC